MMLIRTCLLLLFTIIIKGKHLNGQPSNKFTLVIKSKFPIGNHIGVGEAIFSEHSWASSFKNDSAAYIAGKYIFSGKLLYPTAVRIFSLDTKFKFNELLFVDTGYQEYTLIVNDSLVELNRPQTKIEKEYNRFLEFMSVNTLDHSLSIEKFSAYVAANPSSYVALYALINQTFNYGFYPYIQQIIQHFSPEIWETKGFQHFESEYLAEKKIPEVIVADGFSKKVSLNLNNKDGRYTLLEFWFAGCKGCIPILKLIKSEYYPKWKETVRFISVSTDSKQYMSNSNKILRKVKPQWEVYWDFGAKVFDQYALLYSYPTNLLLNSEGKIIGKNVDLNNLGAYLKSRSFKQKMIIDNVSR